MASLIMHTVVSALLYPSIAPFAPDRNRFFWGHLLPDGRGSGSAAKKITHFRTVSEDGVQICDLDRFTQNFPPDADSLYLGYWCHLVEDWTFRHYLYDLCGYTVGGNFTAILHRDYYLTNAPLIRRYGLQMDFGKPPFIPEALMTYFLYDTAGLYTALWENFHTPAPEDESPVLLTMDMAEEYINMAVKDVLDNMRAFQKQ